MIASRPAVSAGTPTPQVPTTPEQRCLLAKSLLNHREPSSRLAELVSAVMRGVTLGELIDLDGADH